MTIQSPEIRHQLAASTAKLRCLLVTCIALSSKPLPMFRVPFFVADLGWLDVTWPTDLLATVVWSSSCVSGFFFLAVDAALRGLVKTWQAVLLSVPFATYRAPVLISFHFCTTLEADHVAGGIRHATESCCVNLTSSRLSNAGYFRWGCESVNILRDV
jgi:hypothetical protein